MKNKPLKVKSKLKNKWVDVPHKDMHRWFGEYLLSSMVIHAWSKKYGVPDRVGKIEDMIEEADGTGTLPYQAQWD